MAISSLTRRLDRLENERTPARVIPIFLNGDESAAPALVAHGVTPSDTVVIFRTIYEPRPSAN